MIFVTESGANYQIHDGYIRRVNLLDQKHADGEWIELVEIPRVEIGERVYIVMRSLSEYGSDDTGSTVQGDPLGVTARRTTPVKEIFPDDEATY